MEGQSSVYWSKIFLVRIFPILRIILNQEYQSPTTRVGVGVLQSYRGGNKLLRCPLETPSLLETSHVLYWSMRILRSSHIFTTSNGSKHLHPPPWGVIWGSPPLCPCAVLVHDCLGCVSLHSHPKVWGLCPNLLVCLGTVGNWVLKITFVSEPYNPIHSLCLSPSLSLCLSAQSLFFCSSPPQSLSLFLSAPISLCLSPLQSLVDSLRPSLFLSLCPSLCLSLLVSLTPSTLTHRPMLASRLFCILAEWLF